MIILNFLSFFSEEEQYYKVNEIPNKAWLWFPFESIINVNDNQIEERLIKNLEIFFPKVLTMLISLLKILEFQNIF